MRKDKAAWLEDQCRQFDEFNRQSKSEKLFDKIKIVKNNNASCVEQAIIKDKDRIVLDRRERIMERWREYGAELFERPEGEHP